MGLCLSFAGKSDCVCHAESKSRRQVIIEIHQLEDWNGLSYLVTNIYKSAFQSSAGKKATFAFLNNSLTKRPLFCCCCRVCVFFQGQFVDCLLENTLWLPPLNIFAFQKIIPGLNCVISEKITFFLAFFCGGSWTLPSGLIRYRMRNGLIPFCGTLTVKRQRFIKGTRPHLNVFFYTANAVLFQEDYPRSPLSSWVFGAGWRFVLFIFHFWQLQSICNALTPGLVWLVWIQRLASWWVIAFQ